MPGLLDLTQGQGNGLLQNYINRIQEGMSPAYRQEQQQQRALQQDFANMAAIYGPQKALMYVNHPDLLSERLKPQNVEPGNMLMSAEGMGGQPMPQLPGLPQMGSPVTQPPGLQPQQQPAASNIYGTNTNGMTDQGTLERMVATRLLGDKSPETAGTGMGSGSKLNIINKQAYNALLSQRMKEKGITPEMLASRTAKFPAYAEAAKKLTDSGAFMERAAQEFGPIWDAFMQTAARVNTSRFPSVNAFMQYAREHTGDPDVAQLKNYIENTLPSIYARGITGSTQRPLDADKKHIRESLNPVWNTGQLGAVGDAIQLEFKASRDSIPKTLNIMRARDFGMGDPVPPQIAAQFRAAKQAGKPVDKLIARLHENGFDTKGLE